MYVYPVAHAAWSSYVDYLRLTHSGNAENVDLEQAYHMAMLRAARRAGPEESAVERFRLMGYYGYRLGSAFWGRSEQGYMVQCAGVGAAELFDMNLPFTGVPRLDVQVTYWYERENRGVASATAELSVHARAKNRGRPWKVRYINGMGSGDTCYIGSRGKKSKFLRCYDKYAESGQNADYKYAWRYECELTDFHAIYAYNTLRSLGQSDLSCMQVLSGYWQERGISLPYDGTLEALPPGKLPLDITSKERWLRWLKEGVAPSIEKRMLQGCDIGEILAALGLDRREK